MEIAKHYDPSKTEDKWYARWIENDFFHSTPDSREPYTVVIPPPNVTGVLHMGHMLNNTIQDVLIRKARMEGKNALWVPGTDHASIATEAKVVAKLREQGIEKKDISREEFMKKAWEWKETHGGIILAQLKKLGASCDWKRTRFTMEDKLSKAVIKVFVDLYNKGHIYRGIRMVNWDPQGLTAVSDDEVIHKEVESNLYYLNYQIQDSDETLTIATTRPETILGDTAVCLHPDDDRYKHLQGKKAIVPLINKPVPIIYDKYVDLVGLNRIHEETNLRKVIIKSSIIIVTYPETTLSEAMASGCPTLLYYPRYYWETRPEFDYLLNKLEEVKIFHEDSFSITKHLNEINDNPFDWWESSSVRTVRSEFHKMTCILDRNKIDKWKQFINSCVT